MALVVADSHALPAGPADDDALQERGSFTGRPGGPVCAVRGGAGGQAGAVVVVLLHGDVSGVGAGDEGDPFIAGQHGAGQFPAGKLDVAVPPEGERAGIAGVMQDTQHDVAVQLQPVSPLRGPIRCRQGKLRPAVLNAFTHAVADPVAVKVVNRCATAPRTAVSGSRMTCPAAS